MTDLTVLTHSSACIERIFSQVNLVKTKRTQSLKVTTREIILAKEQITKYNNSCKTWKPKAESIKELHNGVCTVCINDIHNNEICQECQKNDYEDMDQK